MDPKSNRNARVVLSLPSQNDPAPTICPKSLIPFAATKSGRVDYVNTLMKDAPNTTRKNRGSERLTARRFLWVNRFGKRVIWSNRAGWYEAGGGLPNKGVRRAGVGWPKPLSLNVAWEEAGRKLRRRRDVEGGSQRQKLVPAIVSDSIHHWIGSELPAAASSFFSSGRSWPLAWAIARNEAARLVSCCAASRTP